MTALSLPPVPPRVSAGDLRTTLAMYRFAIIDEHRLHRALEVVLDECGVRYERERRLRDGRTGKGVGRIDFLTEDGVGVEVKVTGSAVDVARQLRGYGRAAAVRELLLVTTVRRHAQDIPATAAGIPLTIAVLGGGF